MLDKLKYKFTKGELFLLYIVFDASWFTRLVRCVTAYAVRNPWNPTTNYELVQAHIRINKP